MAVFSGPINRVSGAAMNLDERSRVGIYVRVSTTDQSCDLQKRELAQFVRARGWNRFTLYEDHGSSGKTVNRPSLKRLLVDARQRKLDVICCWKLDRLFRSLKDLITVLQEFQELGISFISLRDQVDLSTSAGRLMMQVVGAFGEFEASLISERVKAGLANARAKGKILGRPKIRNDLEIIRLRTQGMSYRSIAANQKTSLGSVQRVLEDK